MTKIITQDSLQRMYNNKKANCVDRLIPFTLTFKEWEALYRLRNTVRCAYTDKEFNFNTTSGDNYPTLERIDSTKGYAKNNICFVTRMANGLKELYDSGKSLKGIGDHRINMIQRIRKVVENPQQLEVMLKPYNDLWKSLETPVAPSKTIVQDIEALREQSIQLQKKAAEEALQGQIEAKIKREQDFAEHYVETVTMFKNLGVSFNLSMKNYRDLMRRTKDAVTGIPFDNIKQKHLFVINKSLPVTKENCKVVHKKTQEALDHMANGDTKVLKQAVKNLSKIV